MYTKRFQVDFGAVAKLSTRDHVVQWLTYHHADYLVERLIYVLISQLSAPLAKPLEPRSWKPCRYVSYCNGRRGYYEAGLKTDDDDTYMPGKSQPRSLQVCQIGLSCYSSFPLNLRTHRHQRRLCVHRLPLSWLRP